MIGPEQQQWTKRCQERQQKKTFSVSILSRQQCERRALGFSGISQMAPRTTILMGKRFLRSFSVELAPDGGSGALFRHR
jgi:hypothetical protein